MNQEAQCAPRSSNSSFGMWLAIGVALGLVVFKNLILGIGIGIALGMTVGKGGCCGTPAPSDPEGYADPDDIGSPEDYADPEDR